jgi:FkbM family methyltransferase
MYSLNNLDEKLLKYLNFNNGFFIEAGANDGISQSNTLMYEKNYGWSGLLIEPSLIKYEECKKNRPNCIVENFALVSDSYNDETIYGDFSHTNVSSSLCGQITKKEDYFDDDLVYNLDLKNKNSSIVNVPCTTLNKLLKKHNIKNIDFFSLDVEGYEIEVLNGFDLNYYKPKYFLIETGNEYRFNLIKSYMESKNYKILDVISDVDTLFTYEN